MARKIKVTDEQIKAMSSFIIDGVMEMYNDGYFESEEYKLWLEDRKRRKEV